MFPGRAASVHRLSLWEYLSNFATFGIPAHIHKEKDQVRIAFIGGGVMAEAIIGGILDAGLASPEDVAVGEPVSERRDYLSERYGLAAQEDNAGALDGASVGVLAVKPQSAPLVYDELRGFSWNDQTMISILAGIRLEALQDGLGTHSVIRVMPNTPAQIRAGMCVWTAAPEVSDEGRLATQRILGTLGKELYVDDEKFIDMSTALSASGPAFVFMFIESLIDAGVYMGMARDMARTLALETVLGSTRLVQETGRHPADLSNMVTSPGGTTAEGLRSLEEDGFRAATLRAVIAAYEKSKALGSG